jgi:hypothetical protein
LNEHTNRRVQEADLVSVLSSAVGDIPRIQLLRDDRIGVNPGTLSNPRDEETGQTRSRDENVANQLAVQGGACLVELSADQAVVLRDLWELTRRLFAIVDDPDADNLELSLRHQSLVKEESNKASDTVGYSYVEVCHSSTDSLSTLPKAPGEDVASRVTASLNCLSSLGAKFAASLVSDMWPTARASEDWMEQLVGGIHSTSPASFQRLARYMDANLEGKETENLGSHCDWSIFTIVPVSEVAGLQIFNGEAWVSPEIVARRHAERDGVDMSDSTSCWNTKYAVVMAGKWLELLTNGRVPSTIHRVISPRGSPRRLSLPFFLRLRPEVLETVEEQLVLQVPTDIKASTLAMSQFLIRKF